MIFSALAALAYGQSFSFDPAVGAARRMLTGFGVGRTRLHSLSEYRGGHFVDLSDANGVTYRVLILANSRCSLVSVFHNSVMGVFRDDQSLRGTWYEKLVKKWLTKLGTKEKVRLESIQGSKPFGRAFFAILRNGYPFVGGGSFGYSFSFSIPGGTFEGYDASDSPPLVSAAKPVISSSQALSALASEYRHLNATAKCGITYCYRLMAAPALGYYASGSGLAPLVWRVSYMGFRAGPFGAQGGSNAILVDAVSGKQIVTRTGP